MPKEKASLWRMFIGDEPGLFARIKHDLSGESEGEWGEKAIYEFLKNSVVNATNLFKNVYVPTPNGTTELDLVFIGHKGIYVIESKAYGGKIYGKPDYQKWIQYIGKSKNTFYNPIKQNQNHCRHLAKALKTPLKNIISFIVFENRTDISKVTKPDDPNIVVCNRDQLYKKILRVVDNRSQVFTEDELATIRPMLRKWSESNEQTKRQHIEQVKNQIYSNKCPFCGKQLVKRQGKHGNFIGCSGYPKCKFTRQIK